MTKSTILAALAFREEGHEVEVLAEKALSGARLSALFGPAARGLKVRKAGRRVAADTARYDLFINQLPGAFFPSFARRSWLWVHAMPLSRPRHLKFYRILGNSKYTRENIIRRWGARAELLYPPVGVDDFSPLAKKRLILTVGALGGAARPKNELRLIRLFKKLHAQGKLPGWNYHLAGELEGARAWLNKLKSEASGVPINFETDAPLKRLRLLYGEAALLWHACKAEHFGVAIVEAMAAGCVPLAPDAGGPRETIAQGKSGWRYSSLAELGRLTLSAIEDRAPLARRALAARARSRRYGMGSFKNRLRALLAEGVITSSA